jgi:hypothetical protein
MFASTSQFTKSLQLVNQLDSAKFPLLLSRIIQKVHLKDEVSFTDEEIDKLQKSLHLPASELKDVIEACEFIFHQAAYHSAKPNILAEQLRQLQLEDDKVDALTDAWTHAARDVISRLRQHSLPPLQLESVNWRLGLQVAQKNQSNIKLPDAVLELRLKDATSGSDQANNIRMEFSHLELYSFYNQLEAIQSQLDSLS